MNRRVTVLICNFRGRQYSLRTTTNVCYTRTHPLHQVACAFDVVFAEVAADVAVSASLKYVRQLLLITTSVYVLVCVEQRFCIFYRY